MDEEDCALLSLLATGLGQREVARHLGVDAAVVTRRVQRLMRFLGAETTIHAVVMAIRYDLIS